MDSNNTINFIDSINTPNKDNRPYINVIIASQVTSGLLDTGATASVCNQLGADFFLSLGYKMLKSPVPVSGTLADGTTVQLLKYFSIPVHFQNKFKLINIFIMSEGKNKILFGSDFAEKFELEIKFFDKSWHVNTKIYHSENSIVDAHELTPQQKIQLSKITKKFNSLCTGELGRSNLFEHNIDTGDALPIFERSRPFSPPIIQRLSNELDRMIKLGVVEPANSAWCQQPVLTPKKNGKDRLCIDSRKLNKVTNKSKYALPRIDSILSRLGKAKFISSIDLQDAFWQIPLNNESKPKTAFNIPGRGMWQFTVVPFGLTTSAQAMQRLMDSLFNDQGEFIYIDDIIIVSETFEEHISALKRVFDKLKSANLTVNIEKCSFCRPSLKYLGYIVDKYGLRTDPEKVSCIADYQLPTTLKELKRFLGMTSYYRRFIRNFAKIAAPLHELTKMKTKTKSRYKILKWNDKAIFAFYELKEAMIDAPVLKTPDFTKKFLIQCDASDHSIGAVISQKDDDENIDRPIAFVSRKLRGAELNYTTTEKECLAVVFAIEKFNQYIEGVKFDVITDHSALIWLLNQKELKGRLARWVMRIQQYDFEVKHIKGQNNVVPDAISRFPQTEDIALIDISASPIDIEYEKLRAKIQKSPDKFEKYKIVDDKIFIKLKKNPYATEFQYKLLVPLSMRDKVIQECHDDKLAAHFGTFKTTKRVLQKYYWQGVNRDVKEYVRKCHICLQSKSQNKRKFGLMGKMKIATRPWQVVSLDLMGPLVRSTKGNDSLLVICDHFTKTPILRPLRNSKAKKICEIVENDVFLEHSIPDTVVCDNGQQFRSKIFAKLLKNYSVKQTFYNCVRHPQNNPTERQNKIIGAAIRSYIEDNHKHWDANLYQIQNAMRTATNVVTGYTPFFLDRGREFIASGSDYILHEMQISDELREDSGQAIEEKAKSLKELCAITTDITKRMIRAYQVNKKYYDSNKVDFNFKTGDIVYRKNFVLSDASKNISAKLAPKYLKCVVKKKISDLAYLLADDTGYEAIYHIKDIKNA